MPKNDIQKQGRILMLPVDCIEPSPYQARTAFDEPEIAALAVSILQNGLLQPISVRRVGIRKYQLVAGERRLRACRLAKLEKVPAILADYDDSESAALGLLENLQRSQLDPFDTARGIKEVIRLWGCTQAEAARRLGLSQPALANKLRLLTLTAEQQQLCTANHLSERHARAALRLPESRRTPALFSLIFTLVIPLHLYLFVPCQRYKAFHALYHIPVGAELLPEKLHDHVVPIMGIPFWQGQRVGQPPARQGQFVHDGSGVRGTNQHIVHGHGRFFIHRRMESILAGLVLLVQHHINPPQHRKAPPPGWPRRCGCPHPAAFFPA